MRRDLRRVDQHSYGDKEDGSKDITHGLNQMLDIFLHARFGDQIAAGLDQKTRAGKKLVSADLGNQGRQGIAKFLDV